MITLEFQNETRSIEGWKDITFGKFLDYLSEIVPQQPEPLKDFIKNHIDFIGEIDEALSEEKKNELASNNFSRSWQDIPPKKKLECYKYFALSIGFWFDVAPADIEDSLNKDELFRLFWSLQSLLDLENAKQDEDFVGFELNKKFFSLPKKHMQGATVSEFSEAAQFQEEMEEVENGRWFGLLDAAVVLCRPRPQEEPYRYDENRHKLRKKQFKNLSMDIIINIGFFLNRQKQQLANNLKIYGLGHLNDLKEVQKLNKLTDGL